MPTRDFSSELNRVAKMAKATMNLLPNVRHPEFFLTDCIPFTKTAHGKFFDLNGFSFSITFLLAYYGVEKKGVIYFVDGYSEFWLSQRMEYPRERLLLLCMYGFNDCFRQEDFYRKYPEIIKKYFNRKDPIAAFQADVLSFSKKIFKELSEAPQTAFRPTGVFGLDYSFTVNYGEEKNQNIGRLSLIQKDVMRWT